MFTEQIEELRKSFAEQLSAADSKEALDAVRVAFLGKKGPINELMKGLRDMTPEERKEAGQAVNTFKAEAESAVAKKGEELEAAALAATMKAIPPMMSFL